MRLAEIPLKSRPEKAGLATINWYSPEGGSSEPTREKDVLHLPCYVNIELFKLQPNYNQFLYCVGSHTWFAGTDEKPFLVRLNDHSFMTFLESGSKGFYHALLPRNMTELAKEVGTRCQFGVPERQTYIRQGDIFAYPLPLSWKDISKACYVHTGKDLQIHKAPLRVYDTRHTLSFGSYLLDARLLGKHLAIVGEGILTAPDHTKVELEGPHAMFQTARLFNPPGAD